MAVRGKGNTGFVVEDVGDDVVCGDVVGVGLGKSVWVGEGIREKEGGERYYGGLG